MIILQGCLDGMWPLFYWHTVCSFLVVCCCHSTGLWHFWNVCHSCPTIIHRFSPAYTTSYWCTPLIIIMPMLCATYEQLNTTISLAVQHKKGRSILFHCHIPLLTSLWRFFIGICYCWLLCRCCSTSRYHTGKCLWLGSLRQHHGGLGKDRNSVLTRRSVNAEAVRTIQ